MKCAFTCRKCRLYTVVWNSQQKSNFHLLCDCLPPLVPLGLAHRSQRSTSWVQSRDRGQTDTIVWLHMWFTSGLSTVTCHRLAPSPVSASAPHPLFLSFFFVLCLFPNEKRFQLQKEELSCWRKHTPHRNGTGIQSRAHTDTCFSPAHITHTAPDSPVIKHTLASIHKALLLTLGLRCQAQIPPPAPLDLTGLLWISTVKFSFDFTPGSCLMPITSHAWPLRTHCHWILPSKGWIRL